MISRGELAILVSLLLCCGMARAQHGDFGAELSATYGHRLWSGASFAFGEKVRLNSNCSQYSQSKSSVSIGQRLLHRQLDLYNLKWKIGGGYTFINRLNEGKHRQYYENQHRFMLQSTLSYNYGFWRASGRVRLQSTFRDESRGSYRYNPKVVLRGRVTLGYVLPDKPWRFGAGAEYFYRANDPKGSFVDEMRYSVETTRIIDGRQNLSLYLKYFHELQVADPVRMIVVGLRYDFE